MVLGQENIFYKKWRWYWQILFACKRFMWTQVWIFDQKAGIKHTGIKHFNDPNAFIEGSNKMDHVYENMY